MSTQTKLDWKTQTLTAGRVAHISDEAYGSWAQLPEGMTLQEAADDYERTYDFGDCTEEISCYASLKIDGEEIEGFRFSISK